MIPHFEGARTIVASWDGATFVTNIYWFIWPIFFFTAYEEKQIPEWSESLEESFILEARQYRAWDVERTCDEILF
jgi:hypothetical protein